MAQKDEKWMDVCKVSIFLVLNQYKYEVDYEELRYVIAPKATTKKAEI